MKGGLYSLKEGESPELHCIYIYIYTYICICTYIYIYIYIYIFIKPSLLVQGGEDP